MIALVDLSCILFTQGVFSDFTIDSSALIRNSLQLEPNSDILKNNSTNTINNFFILFP